MDTPFGFINAFKPPGQSSAAFGNWVRHVSHATAAGHWGTLDPGACGVLVLALGKATKLLPLLPHARKQYVFEFVPGRRTDTGDATGTVVARSPVPADWADGLAAAAASLVGTVEQIPPMHSAVKVGGRPLYHAARKGMDIARAPRSIQIYELCVIGCTASAARLYLECEAGTYVRVLCEELGRRLDLPAHMGALLRVGAGPFCLRDSVRPDQIAADARACLIDPLRVLESPRVDIDDRAAQRFAHGNDVRLPEGVAAQLALASQPDEVLVTHAGKLIGCGHVASIQGAWSLAPASVFVEPLPVRRDDGPSGPSERQGSAAVESNG